MLLAALADFYVDALRKTAGNNTPLINADQPKIVDIIAQSQDTNSIVSALHTIADTETNLSRNANIELTLEALFIKLAHVAHKSKAG